MTIRVGVNGYGTIGKRVADAVKSMPDMELVGVVKVNPDYGYYIALEKNIPVYTLRDRLGVFRERGLQVEGVLEDLLEQVDVIIDATPAGYGEYYFKKYYSSLVERNRLKVVFQGGEKAEIAEHSFNAYCNPEEIIGSRTVRVVSCNTTGLLRIICVLDKLYGVRRVRATIIRRGADPKEDKRGPINSIRLNPPRIPSHHALDVKTVVPKIDVETAAVIVPTTLMHVHSVYIVLDGRPDRDELISYLRRYRRIILLSSEKTGIDSTAKIVETSRDLGRRRYDVPELVIWEDTIHVKENELWLLQAVHQESIVVPENIDAIRGLMNTEGYPVKSIELTDKVLNIGFFLEV